MLVFFLLSTHTINKDHNTDSALIKSLNTCVWLSGTSPLIPDKGVKHTLNIGLFEHWINSLLVNKNQQLARFVTITFKSIILVINRIGIQVLWFSANLSIKKNTHTPLKPIRIKQLLLVTPIYQLLCHWKLASYLELKWKHFWKEKDHQTTKLKMSRKLQEILQQRGPRQRLMLYGGPLNGKVWDPCSTA